MKKILFILCCILISGCVASENKLSYVDETNTLNVNYNPMLKIKVAQDLTYVNEIIKKKPTAYRVGGLAEDRINYFICNYDPEISRKKMVVISRHTIHTAGVYYETLMPLPDPRVVEHGEIQFSGHTWQYGIGLNIIPVTSDEMHLLIDDMKVNDYYFPNYIITKFYRRIGGHTSNSIITVCYMESVNSKIVNISKNSTLTADQKNYIAAFSKRCDQNMIVQ